MFKTVTETLSILQEDNSIIEVLNTVGAAAVSLGDGDLSVGEAWALSLVCVEAEKRIREIIQSKAQTISEQ